MKNTDQEHKAQTPSARPRKSYEPPKLIHYGTVEQHTKAMDSTMSEDGGAGCS